MNSPSALEYLASRLTNPWVVGYCEDSFYQSTLYYFKKYNLSQGPIVLFGDIDRLEYLAQLIAAISTDRPVFLTGPNYKYLNNIDSVDKLSSCIMIPTGGSSGEVRFAKHTWQSLVASVMGFKEYFAIEQVNSFCLLPLYHVSGLMQALRTLITGGKLIIFDYAAVKSEPPELDFYSDYFISLVPTQLKFMLDHFPQWLEGFGTVLLGGAPPWNSLLQSARVANIQLALTYGMTETASMVAALSPQEFLQGNCSSGKVLPHSKITIEEKSGEIGTIVIESSALCLGYYPEHLGQFKSLQTDDLGYFDQAGYLNIVGRKSQKIITGGEKLYPKEVEEALLNTGLVSDVVVIGYSDSYWGEIVTAIYTAEKKVEPEQLKEILKPNLASYKIPKKWLQVEAIARNAQGKVNIREIEQLVKDKASL